jgi:polyphosphate kinase
MFRFGKPGPDVRYLFGSADLMPRNLSGRVEAMTPVEDPVLQERLEQIFQTELADDTLAWELGPDGSWTKVPTTIGIDTHEIMQQLALERAQGTA